MGQLYLHMQHTRALPVHTYEQAVDPELRPRKSMRLFFPVLPYLYHATPKHQSPRNWDNHHHNQGGTQHRRGRNQPSCSNSSSSNRARSTMDEKTSFDRDVCVCVCGKSSSRTIFSATYFSVRGGTDPRRFRPDVLLDVRDHGGACSNHPQEHHSHTSTHAASSLIRWVCSLAFLFCPFGYFPPEIRYEKNDRQRWGWKT